MNQNLTTVIPLSALAEIRRMAKKQLKGKGLLLIPPMLIYVLLFTIPNVIFLLLFVYLFPDIQMERNAAINDMPVSVSDLREIIVNSYLSAGGWTFDAFILLFILIFYISCVAGPLSVSFSELSLRVLRNEKFRAGTMFSGFRQFNKSFAAAIKVISRSVLWLMLFLIFAFFSMLFMLNGVYAGNSLSILLPAVLLLLLLFAFAVLLAGYKMTYFIAADDGSDRTEIETGFDSVSESVRLMKGNRCTYFLLQLSFLPWFILLLLPAGLAGGTVYISGFISSGVLTTLLIGIAAVFGVIFLAGIIFLMIYMKTASAVFYSGVTGNFRSAESAAENILI